MDEEINTENSVVEQVATDAVEIPQPDTQEMKRQDRNWREINRAKRELENEVRIQREINERLLQMTAKSAPEVDELSQVGDEDYLNKAHTRKLIEREAAKIAQQETEKILKQREAANFKDRLLRQYPDFNDVVNDETLAQLEEKDPELAQTILDLNDPYKVCLQSYKYIKAMNIADPKSVRRAREVDEKLEKNAKTIASPQAFDKRPMAQAFKMTEEMKDELYKEMMGFAQQAGFSY